MKTFLDIIDSMPVGLERSLGRILSKRVGKENAIERDQLLELVRRMPGLSRTDDRQMRIAIQSFRNQGIRICHCENRVTDPESGRTRILFGYYLAADEQEYREFRARYGSYAHSIWQTIRSMDEEHQVITAEGDVEPPPGVEVQGQLFSI